MTYNKNLDSLRALAALAVIAFHWRTLVSCGWVGVQLFYVLSGFLITGILLREKGKHDTLKSYYKEFIVRRSLRLLPLYLALVGICLVMYHITGKPGGFLHEQYYLYTYTLNFARMSPSYVGSWMYNHTWSLSVEWQFYLGYPFVIWYASKATVKNILITMLFLGPMLQFGTLLWAQAIEWGGSQDHVQFMQGCFVYNASWSQIDAFAIGGILCWDEVNSAFTRPKVVCAMLGTTLLAGLSVLVAQGRLLSGLGSLG